MPIKKYTSQVSVINSINRIEHRLLQAGVTHISKSYSGNGSDKPVAMIFQITINDIPHTFKLPAKVEKVYKNFLAERRKPPTESVKQSIKAQAERTAWKILSDWIDIQVSLIELDQAEASEVFFPYLYDPQRDVTVYQLAKENNFTKLLTQ